MLVGVCTFLVQFSFLLIKAQSVPPGPPIIIAPETATEGETIIFQCTSYGGEPSPDLTWKRTDGTTLSPAFKTVFSYVTFETTVTSVSEHSYQFIANRLHNGMMFVCEAKNNELTISANTTFTVYVTPSPPSLTQQNEVLEGDDVSWQCVVDGAYPDPVIIWTFNDYEFTGEITEEYLDYGDLTSKVTSTLIRTFTRADSGGTLKCEVSHKAYGTDIQKTGLDITVNYVADITAPQISYETNMHENIILLCDVGDARPNVTSIRWYHNAEIVPAGMVRFSDTNLASPSLKISDLQPEDNGDYICSAVSSVGESNTTVISLTVWYPPQVTVPPISSANGSDTVIISCSITAKPAVSSVYWLKIINELPVIIDPYLDPQSYSGGTLSTPDLTIKSVGPDDAGYYQCKANNLKGTGQSDLVQLIVFYPPQNIDVRRFVEVLLGQDFNISCSALANPAAVYHWTFNDVTIETGNKLQKENVEKTDAGEYVCVASNDRGSGNVAVTVEVQYLPEILVPQTLYEANSKTDVILPCNVDAVPEEGDIVWYKVGDTGPQEISLTGGSQKYLGGIIGATNLTIKDLENSDSGSYYCEVTNTIGTVQSEQMQLIILYVLENIQVYPKSQTITEGKQFSAKCNVTSNPEATITWALDGGKQVEDGPIFERKDVSRTLSGVYICMATNGKYILTTPFILVVQYKPDPVQAQYSYEVEDGDTVSLVCQTDAVPSPKNYVWSHNGNQVAENGLELIVDVTDDSLGTYMCYAENSVGVSNQPINFKLELKDSDDETGTGTVGASTGEELSTGATAAIALAVIFGILVIIIIIVCCIAQGLCSFLPCLKKKEANARVAPEKQPPVIPHFVERHSPEKGTNSVVSRKDVNPIITHKYHSNISDERPLVYNEAEFGHESPRYHSLPMNRSHLMGDLSMKKNNTPSISNGPIISVYDDSYRAPAPQQIQSIATPISRPNQLPALESIFTYDEEERKRKKRRRKVKRPDEEQDQSPYRKQYPIINGDIHSPQKHTHESPDVQEEMQETRKSSRSRGYEDNDPELPKKHRKHRKHSKSRHKESRQSEDGQRSKSRSRPHSKDVTTEAKTVSIQHYNEVPSSSKTEDETIKVEVTKPRSVES